MAITVSSLHIHPIKSLGGFSVNEARITPRGFEHDRRWMLVDGDGVFITQRELPLMAMLHCSSGSNGFRVSDTRDDAYIDLPWEIEEGERRRAWIWRDEIEVVHAPVEVSAWFADRLGITCSLVHMPETTHRPINPTYAKGITALNDGYPYMILSQASLDDLNARINGSISRSADQPMQSGTLADRPIDQLADLGMDRFRPSIVIAGGEAYQEDGWKEIAIGEAKFSLVKPSLRCAITTTDQRTGERGKEPLRMLATYRRIGNDVKFGMNAVAVNGEVVRVGDPLHW